MLTGLLLSIIVGLGLPLLAHTHSQQKRERVIKKASQPNEPMDLEDIQVRGSGKATESVNVGTTFLGDEDWLKGLTVKVKNKSGKSISYAELYVYVPTSETEDKPIRLSLRYGVMPSACSETDASNQSKLISHGSSTTLTLSDSEYDLAKGLLSEKNVTTDFKQIEMRIGMVIFDDGTAWKNGSLLHRDPNDPSKWNVVDKPNPKMALNRSDFLVKAVYNPASPDLLPKVVP